MSESGNPWQREEDLADDKVSLYRRIFALKGEPNLKVLVAQMLVHIEGDRADVSGGRIKNFIKEAKKQEKYGGL